MNPYQPGEDNQDPYEVGYKAGKKEAADRIGQLQAQRNSAYKIADHYRLERDALQAEVAELVAALEKQVAHDKAVSYERCPDCDYGQKCSRESGCQDIKNHSPIANTALAKVRKP